MPIQGITITKKENQKFNLGWGKKAGPMRNPVSVPLITNKETENAEQFIPSYHRPGFQLWFRNTFENNSKSFSNKKSNFPIEQNQYEMFDVKQSKRIHAIFFINQLLSNN